MVTLERGIDLDILIQRELGYAARLENAGPKALIVPIGDPRYGALSGSTLTTKGAQQVTFTNQAGNWNAMATPLRGTARVPIWTPDGVNDYIKASDAAFWNDTAGVSEPSYSLIMWVNVKDGSATRGMFSKSTTTSTTGGQDWTFFINSLEHPLYVIYDDVPGSSIGRVQNSAMTNGWRHIVLTKSTGTTAAAINITVDGVVVDDTDRNGGTYVNQEDGGGDVAIGADNDGSQPTDLQIAGADCGPVFIDGQVLSLNQIKEDFRITSGPMANVLGT